MATIIRLAPDSHPRRWECKHCRRLISDAETVAYHLINRILYGWCEACFRQREQGKGLSLATPAGSGGVSAADDLLLRIKLNDMEVDNAS